MTDVQTSIAVAAVKNPIVQAAVKKSMFDALAGDEDDRADTQEMSIEDQQEDAAIKQWATRLKYAMIIISSLLMITAIYNLSSTGIAMGFLAFYLFIFSLLMCCYEVAFAQAGFFIAQNFGFMYNSLGRGIFVTFVAILAFQMSVMGKVCFSFLLLAEIVYIYVHCKHPKFEAYMRKLHYNKGRPNAQLTPSPAYKV